MQGSESIQPGSTCMILNARSQGRSTLLCLHRLERPEASLEFGFGRFKLVSLQILWTDKIICQSASQQVVYPRIHRVQFVSSIGSTPSRSHQNAGRIGHPPLVPSARFLLPSRLIGRLYLQHVGCYLFYCFASLVVILSWDARVSEVCIT